MKTKTRENERRDSVILIILILLLGFICIIITSGWALRFSPSWKLNTNMGSNLNPNSNFLNSRPVSFLEPLDPAILTNPPWFDVFLTPGALIPTRVPPVLPTLTATSVPPQTSTPTPTVIPSATNTLIFVSPTNTKATFPPPTPSTATNTPVPPPPSANLQITKSNGVAAVTAGATTTYTVRVTNLGPSNVTGAILGDPLATGLNKIAVACSLTPGQCVTAPTAAQLQGGAFTLPALASGQFYEIIIAENVTALNGSVTNTASVTTPAGTIDPIPANNTASDTDTVTPAANLSITKTDGVTTVLTGGTTTYTVRVTNLGPSNVTGATLSDALAIGLTKTTVVCSTTPGQCVTAPTVAQLESGAFTLPALASGQFYEIAITVNVTALSGNVTNTAAVTTPVGTLDPTPANNTASDTDTVTPVANLSITKTDGVVSVTTGANTIYTVRVTNAGPSSVTGAVLSDIAATGLSKTSVACSTTPGQCVTAPTVAQLEAGTFALPALVSGQFYEVTITANVTALSGNVINTAAVTTPVGTLDPTPANNTASDTDAVTPVANLSITKTDGVASVTAGGSTTYTVRVTNAGPSSVTGAILSDVAATGLSKTAVACSATPGQCVTAPTVAQLEAGTFALPALTSGQFYEITITANVTALSGTVANTATVAAPVGTTDPIPGNNLATDTDTVIAAVDLQITKTDGVTTYTPGNSVTYSIVVTNPTGPSNVTGATVTDTFPAQVASATWTCAAAGGATCTASGSGSISDTVNIPAGGALTYTVTANTAPSATVNLINTASVSVPFGYIDTNPANNSATDTDTPVFVADLQITKTDNATEYAPGISVQYTIVVFNAGPSNVTGASVTDNVPGQITAWAWSCTSQTGGASGCTAAPSFAGNFTDTVDLPSGASITYTVTANIDAAATGSLVNTATVSSAVTDPAPGNNSATDTDTLIVPDALPGSIGSNPDSIFYSVNAPGCLTLNFPISVGGHAGFDFVYYEQPNGSGIWLDWVIVQVSAGQNWFTIFNWGDEVRDTNTNVDFNILTLPVIPAAPPEERDERDVLAADLYNNTGVAIDLDGVVPDGTYPYVRFCAPLDGNDNKMEIDAIAIIP